MDLIFFEKQEGQLCAQHALNALLQGAYFMPTDLADIARRLDNEERGVYGEGGGYDSPEYLRQFQADSQNMDDSGFFSSQVISEALKIWNLELVPFMSRSDEGAVSAQQDPTSQTAYICNFRQHWFTIRKIGYQWFNLNSMLNKQELISDTYLHLFLTQLQNEGYSIFVVIGELPRCAAEEELMLTPAAPAISTNRTGAVTFEDEDELAKALKLSMEQGGGSTDRVDDDDEASHSLNQVIAASRQNHDADDVSLQRALTQSLADREEEDIEMALRMSLGEEIANPSFAGKQSFKPDAHSATFLPGRSQEASHQNINNEIATNHSDNPDVLTALNANELSVEELRKRRLAHLERLQNLSKKPDLTKM